MGNRKFEFAVGEFYHVYNRGVDKRITYSDRLDILRFLECMTEFNTADPIGSLYERSFDGDADGRKKKEKPLVRIVAYCLNPNHYHLLLEQVGEGGVSEFMKRLNGGYTTYFNNRHKRTGALFQGVFKARHVDTNEYLLHVSAYVNLNDRVHQLGGETPKPAAKERVSASSWEQYESGKRTSLCDPRVILDQFKNQKEYLRFALAALEDIQQRKEETRDLERLLLEEIE